MSYRNLAFERWTGRTIHGAGRYALVNDRSGDVFLFETLDDAVKSAAFHNCKPIDLAPKYVPTIPDDYEDVLWERKQSKKS